MSDWNAGIIEEFRTNEGNVGGPFQGHPCSFSITRAPKPGPNVCRRSCTEAWTMDTRSSPPKVERTTTLTATTSKQNPETEVEVGSERVAVKARVAEGEESEAIWSRHKSEWPLFAEYEAKTTRETIPVVVLEPVG